MLYVLFSIISHKLQTTTRFADSVWNQTDPDPTLNRKTDPGPDPTIDIDKDPNFTWKIWFQTGGFLSRPFKLNIYYPSLLLLDMSFILNTEVGGIHK